MNIKTIILVASVITLGACSSTESQDNKKDEMTLASAKSNGMVCEHRASTGSHLKKRSCMSKELADEIREHNKHDMGKLLNSNKGDRQTRDIAGGQ
ncbi:hypothetical protein RGQ13_13595 [Thalassotalea psychrophila]|uniref:Lipoprotein n=1 Tax=Thalassotalea psychrophila TaxID=3065647 RepID=A0ABY9TRV3_9GAMM|nr:hypothetical protein RGQ13_13595 [Colwelliaceae bacterium SQ149]